MARPAAPGSVIVPDWHESAQGKEYLACVLRKSRRRVFGLLERPVFPPPVAIDTASYKIFVSGKSGVGKTALVAKLAGLEVPVVHHETTGIQTTVVFWPAKLQASDRVVMFRFEFWDCGESALKKFEHMLPACKENADAFLFLFSFTDRASFEDLPGQLARVAGEAPGVVKMVIGSKFDQYVHTDVPERDLAAFRQAWPLPLLRVKSVPGRRLADGRTLDGRAGLADVAHVLNGLAEQLWHQDQFRVVMMFLVSVTVHRETIGTEMFHMGNALLMAQRCIEPRPIMKSPHFQSLHLPARQFLLRSLLCSILQSRYKGFRDAKRNLTFVCGKPLAERLGFIIAFEEYSDVASARELRRQQREEEGAADEAEGAEEGPGPPRADLSPSSSFRAQRAARGSTFSLWQDIPDVRGSGVLATLSLQDCKLQEAKFELITSEASYIHSLSVAVGHFLGSAELSECLGTQDKQWLFSKLPEVKGTSERFLQDLEQRLEADVLRFSVCDVVLQHCPAFRRVYLPYVTNQAYQERTYQRLLLENPKFPGILARLEESPVCQRLPLTSFLILPFQRITRLKMLVENILKRTVQGSEDEDMATKAFNALKELVQECNASVQSMKRTEELIHLSKKIHFEGKIFPLISQARWLVRHGELVELAPLPAVPPAKLKLSSKAVYLHLFNDCLLLSRRKELGKFAVFVHAKMAELQVKDLSLKLQGIPGHVFLLQLLHGQRTKHQFLLRAQTESEKQRWISAMCPSSPQEDKEVISEGEDHPQVQCVRTYKALQPDELTLEKTDILAVRMQTSDGWLEGVRLADGEKGWVPQAYVEEISSLSARLRNLRENKRVTSATSKLGAPPV
ncbi:hypothetical protein MG293_005075 [Ovis ammon polii]|uniref:Ciliogenesis and planar polarity effector 2 n=1 Tax=Ovis ammon polii TaxID=230172 RepID=A0AAD4YE94_OVIAM|nr:hypothetical protein MG293_005075 [Ovis ammon polii]